MGNKETIKQIVNEEFIKNMDKLNEVEIYRLTSGIPNERLRASAAVSNLLLIWIKEIIENSKENATNELKIECIKELFNVMDKYIKAEMIN